MYEQKDSRRFSAARQALAVLLSTLRARQPQLSAHVEGVSRLAVSVGHRLGLDPIELRSLARAAELHDIGKIAIPDAILDKSAGLTTDEWDFMHQHTVLGARILSAAPALEPLAAVVRSSHERWDGKGYPDGLAGEEIPLASRIIFVCDAFHAMITARPYAGARNEEEALEEIRRCAGGQFDPAVVAAFEAVRKEGFPAPEIPDEDLADIGSVVRGDIAAEPSARGPGGLAPTAGPRGPAVGAPSA
jgi:HD-GYP domain-containing protein (c-di-GMP phosphodiesterase class II)